MKKKNKYDLIVIGISAVIFAFIFIMSQIYADVFVDAVNSVVNFLVGNLGWFINIATLLCILFALYFMFSKYGKIKLGGKDAKPEFKTFTWWAISLCAGMGMGIVFFPPAEVIEYTFRPAEGAGLVAGSYEAVRWAMENTTMHWSLTLYGVYVIAGLVAAYIYHNMKQPFSISATLYPLFGDKVYRYRSIIDGIVTFAIVGGVAGSFGYGILQISSGLSQVFGIPQNNLSYIIVGIVIALVYILSSVSGLKKGIQWLGDNNAKIFIFMMVFVVVFGPTLFSLGLGTETTGSMLTNFFKNMTFNEPMVTGSDKWSVWWNWLWYLDFFIFAPTTGFFLARLGRGRTIREFVTVNMVAPMIFGIGWCWLFSGLAVHEQFFGNLDLNAIMLDQGTEAVMLTLFDTMPLGNVMKVIMMVVIVVSFVTLANAVTNTVSKMSMKTAGSADDEDEEPPKGIQIFWGVLMAGIALLFLLKGGLDGAKAVKLLVGIPIVFLQMVVLFGFVKMFWTKQYREVEEIEGPEAAEAAADARRLKAEKKARKKTEKQA